MASAEQMQAARGRRQQRFEQRLQWYGDRLAAGIEMNMEARMKLATQLLRDKVVINISVPVVKTAGKDGRIRVTERSSPGEFPRADTTRLMKDIFNDTVVERNRVRGFVGTTLDYGLYLETSPRLNRAFLVPTLNEMLPRLAQILGGPMNTVPGMRLTRGR